MGIKQEMWLRQHMKICCVYNMFILVGRNTRGAVSHHSSEHTEGFTYVRLLYY
jgi:hypothetical protein